MKVSAAPAPRHVTRGDPLNVNARLYQQIGQLLTQLEEGDGEKITLKERLAALMAIARIQAVFVALRKEQIDEPDRGSAVKKYASAFQDGASRGTGGARARKPDTTDALSEDWFESADRDDDLAG
jgi:hypothetical protein